ncbi:hypothetical protein FUSO5_05535 [Fusobacterium necrophorum BFTR-1]|nr:hypothetical protein FUSO5_05535 [Fusobacterium necrophorum BFTR-1]
MHAIVSLGGFNKYFAWKTLDYFHVNVIANQWKFIVLRLIQSGNYQNPIWKQKAKQVANKLYKENARLFFLVEGQEVNSTEGLLKHLGRYLAGAPIADYKIVNVTEKEVTFFFHDLANNKEKTYVTMSREKFIQQVLIHLLLQILNFFNILLLLSIYNFLKKKKTPTK